MIRTIYFYFFLVVSVMYTSLYLIKWHFLGLFGHEKAQWQLAHKVSHRWAAALVNVSGMRVVVKGQENIPSEGAVLFVSNHQSNFDIGVLLGCIDKPKGFVAKIELAKIPIVTTWMRKMGSIYIDRQDIKQSLRTINEGIEVLKKGRSLVLFPEGTRSRGPIMGKFKKGSLRLAEKSHVPIIPVTINGSYKMDANKGRIKPSRVEVIISPPIVYDDLAKEDQKNITEIVWQVIAANLKAV